VVKVGGGAAVVGKGGVLEPFPGAGGLDWRILRIDVGGVGLPLKGENGGNLWSVDEKNRDNFSILLFEAGKMPRMSPQPKKISEVDTSGEYSEPWVLSRVR
jgi:hypothetical protein